jgi:integrase
MPKRALTAAAVERIKPPVTGQIEYFDKGWPGLSLRLSYGGQKAWGFYYRINGRLRRMSLGTFPAMSLGEARDAWRQARQDVAKGIDPGLARKPERTADAFDDVVAQWLREDQAKNKASTFYQTSRIVQHDIMPAWSGRRLDQITRRDIRELVKDIATRAPIKARRVHAHLHRLFAWCVAEDILPASPMVGLPKPGSESSRERVLTDYELVAVWRGADQVPPFGQVVRLLLLTGARLSEIGELKWSELEGDNIRLNGERTKNGKPHLIPLSAPARALLDSLPRIAGSDYVFTVDGKRPVSGWSRAKAKIDAAAETTAWRVHDIRRTVATGMQRLGVTLQTVESVLGHVSGSRAGIVGIYQLHDFADEKRAALEAWGARVTDLVEGRKPGVVVPLRA